MNDDAKPIQVQLVIDERDLTFDTPAELSTFANEELAFFNYLVEGAKENQAARPAMDETQSWLRGLQALAEEYRAHPLNRDHLRGQIDKFHNVVTSQQNRGVFRSSVHPHSIYTQKLASETSPAIAGIAMTQFMGLGSANEHRGHHLALQYEAGNAGNAVAQEKSLETIRENWAKSYGSTIAELQSRSESIDQARQATLSQLEKLYDSMETKLSEFNDKFHENLEIASKNLNDIERTYDEKLALQSSVSYWTKKEQHHATVMKVWGIASICLALFVCLGMGYTAYAFLDVPVAETKLWHLGVALVVSTFGIWSVRIVTKIFVSNLHLHTDAKERVTMIQTYLAMLRDGSGPEEKERLLILQTLFRPSSTGYLSDEGPTNLHETIGNVLSRKN